MLRPGSQLHESPPAKSLKRDPCRASPGNFDIAVPVSTPSITLSQEDGQAVQATVIGQEATVVSNGNPP